MNGILLLADSDSGHCQLIEADAVIRQTGMLPRSSLRRIVWGMGHSGMSGWFFTYRLPEGARINGSWFAMRY
jgi:hypothetical protein